MAQPEPEISFDPFPRKIGLEWRVIATHSSGQNKHITGFATEAEAIEWLVSKGCQGWGMARLIARGEAI
jgi:hypothetical protein